MAILRHGFFFFFLSKLFAVNCSTANNPSGPVHYGEPVYGMFNSWAGQQPAATQGMTNNYNAYSYNPQGLQPNSEYPNYQQQMNYGQQMTTTREPQSYSIQEYYPQNPPQTAQPNPVVQDEMEKSQSQQSNSNNAYQLISTQYSPKFNNFNTDFNQPDNQEKQSSSPLPNTQPPKPQAQYVQPQSNQFSPPSQNGQEVPHSVPIPISSSPNEYQNQFSSKTNPQPQKVPSPATFKPALSEAQTYNPSLSNFKPQSFPMSSSLKPQQYQSNTLDKNAQQQQQQQQQQHKNSPAPLQFKKPEVPPKSSTQFSQSNSSPNESQSSSLPVSSLSQQLTGQTTPIMQNTSQSPQPTKSSPPSQLKTSEVKPEPNSQTQPQFQQNNFSSNQYKPPQLTMFPSSQLFKGQTKPTMKNTSQPPQPTKFSPPSQLKTSEVKPEPNSQIQPQFQQNNFSSDQSKPPPLPTSSSLEPSQFSPLSNPINSPQAIKLFPPIKLNTPKAQSDSNTSSQNEPQFPQSNFFSNQKNPPQSPLPTKSSPLSPQSSEVQSESKTPPQMNVQSSYVNSSPYQSQSFPLSSSLQSSPNQSIPTGQNSPQPTKSSPPLQPSQNNFPLQQSKIQSKPFEQNTQQSPQSTKPFPPKKSNIPDELPISNNNSLNAPIITNLNNLEPFQTLPQSSSSDLSQYFVQDQDITILNSQSKLPNALNSGSKIPIVSSNDSNDDLPFGLGDNKNANDNTLGPQNGLNNDELPDYDDEESNLESKLKRGASRVAFETLQTPTDSYDTNNPTNLLENGKPNETQFASGLGAYDKTNPIDIEDSKNAEEENVKFRVFADPNDIHVININPTQTSPSTTVFNSQPTRNSWSVPQWPNNAGVQQSDDYSDKLLSSLFNSNKNEMSYNQFPTGAPNNNYDRTFSNTPQDISKNANQTSSTSKDDGQIYKQVDLIKPPSTVSSWSLRKQDYSKNKRPNQNNGISPTSVFETPHTYNQNNNQYPSGLSMDNTSVQNLISAISTAVGAPPEGTRAIFDLTQASFPNANVIQQLNLTYSVVQSIILSLRKILNTVVNHLFGHRVKRDFNMLGPMSNISPKTTAEPVHNFPAIADLKKKDYQSTSGPNTNSYSNQPTATTGIFSNQLPYSQQYFPPRPDVGTKKQQQQMYNGAIDEDDIDDDDDDDDDDQPQDSVRATQQAPSNTRGYIADVLANEIRTQVYSNLPDSYSSDGPEVEEYCRQMIFTVEMFFRNQINNVIQGHSPTKNMFSTY